MNDDLSRSLFLKAKEQYDFAARVGYVLIVAILLFHLLTLTSYLQQSAKLERTRVELGTLAQSRDRLKEASSDLEQLADNTQHTIQALGDTLFRDLVSDFGQLDAAVQLVLPQTSSSAEALLRPRPALGAAQIAMQPATPFVLDQSVLEQIRAVKSDEELRRVLRPVVERKIVAPRFAYMNRSWRQVPERTVVEVSSHVEEKLQRVHWPEEADRLTELKTSISHLGTSAARVEFKPPADIKWWQSRQGKGTSISNIEEETIKGLAVDQVAAQSRTLLDAIEVTVQQHKSLLDEIQQRMRDDEEQFKDQQQKIATLAKPLQFLSLDLGTVALRFPVLLGLLFGAGAAWLAACTRELRQASERLLDQNMMSEPGSLLAGGILSRAFTLTVVLFVSLAWIWIAA